MKSRAVVGRTIVDVVNDRYHVGETPGGKWMENTILILDDGSVIQGTVQEDPEGGDYGVPLNRHPKNTHAAARARELVAERDAKKALARGSTLP